MLATHITTPMSTWWRPVSMPEPDVCAPIDPNGNLAADGLTSYTWNARNQLVGMSGGTSATFGYDGFGRRRSKTVGGTATNFLYDDLNLVQEQTGGGTPTANLLTGAGVDETFTRTDSSGTSTLLTGALGSTLALADASGTLQTHYTYDPFGTTTVSGATSANTQQFTDRENDGTGLYGYRARFYSPGLQRFISEDPLEFAAGDVNLYAYVGNQPTIWRDPSGLILYRPLPGSPCYIPPSGRKDETPKPPLSWYFTCSPFVVPDLIIPPWLPGTPPHFPGWDPTDPPPGYRWEGPDPPGGRRGNYTRPGPPRESLHPDLGHPDPPGPHWDWKDPLGRWWRIPPNGPITPK